MREDATLPAVTDGESVLMSLRGSAAVLTINRPAVRNALNGSMTAALLSAIDRAQRDPAARVIVITGAGTAFCSGDDVRELTALTSSQFTDSIRRLQQLTTALLGSTKPVIAAINGPALGAGLELTLACDIRIASSRATFGCPEAALGMVATNAASMLLPRIVGAGRAAEMLLTARSYGPEWALSAGLVSHVVPEQGFWAAVTGFAELLSGRSVTSLRLTRELLRPPEAAVYEALERETTAVTTAHRARDAQEGLKAFSERRPPAFTDDGGDDE
jgi:enoyl-CoA hydratase/carnithine racemase